MQHCAILELHSKFAQKNLLTPCQSLKLCFTRMAKMFKYLLEFVKLVFIELHTLQVFLELRRQLECIFVIQFLSHRIQRLLT